MSTAKWVGITRLPAQPDRTVPLLLDAGALEVQVNVRPARQWGRWSVADSETGEPGEVIVTISALWPGNLTATPDDVIRDGLAPAV